MQKSLQGIECLLILPGSTMSEEQGGHLSVYDKWVFPEASGYIDICLCKCPAIFEYNCIKSKSVCLFMFI